MFEQHYILMYMYIYTHMTTSANVPHIYIPLCLVDVVSSAGRRGEQG